ncbi:hypothetical protein WR25_02870 [Diploscapter pachys]|uniref:Uncharacterized protein n=1 Tax=Diploscapter pachys TaxID=2018661 RepID=A0A2A2KQH3_9BILA|nr:hypothetical protein WR25_02870 [Diploscapter pachys]
MARIMNGDRQIPVVGELGTGTAANVMNVVGGGRPGIQRWGPLGTNEKNIEGESDGWEFWSRVYSNPVLKQQMDEKAQNEPSISQLLQQEHLCQAELIFLNVPRLAHEQKGAIKQLIEKEVGGGNVPMLDIQIAPKRWRLRFYRSADAHRVMQHLNGFIYRGKALMVHYSPSTTAVPLENDSEVSSGDRANDLNGGRQYHRSTPFHQQPFDYDAFEGKSVIDLEIAKNKPSIWSDVELHDMKNFELDLVHYVSTHDGSLLHSALAALSHRKGVASAAIDLWPTAFVRLFHPKVNLVGRYLTVNSSHTAYLLKKASMEVETLSNFG